MSWRNQKFLAIAKFSVQNHKRPMAWRETSGNLVLLLIPHGTEQFRINSCFFIFKMRIRVYIGWLLTSFSLWHCEIKIIFIMYIICFSIFKAFYFILWLAYGEMKSKQVSLFEFLFSIDFSLVFCPKEWACSSVELESNENVK